MEKIQKFLSALCREGLLTEDPARRQGREKPTFSPVPERTTPPATLLR